MKIKTKKLEDAVSDFALSFFAVRGERIDPSGSAVLIARDYVLTARHVIEGHCQTFNNNLRLPRVGEVKTNYRVYAQHHVSGYGNICRTVERSWISTLTDLAIVKLKEPSEKENAVLKKLSAPVLRLTPPDKGTSVCGFGFCEPDFSLKRLEKTTSSVQWKLRGRSTRGFVTAPYPESRDSGLINFPSFQTDADFLHSMSGGPVFDEKGRVCGLISAGSTFTEGGPGTFSYVASLWPMMAIFMDQVVAGNPDAKVLVHELAKNGLFFAEDWGRVSIDADLKSFIVKSVSLHNELGVVLATIRNT